MMGSKTKVENTSLIKGHSPTKKGKILKFQPYNVSKKNFNKVNLKKGALDNEMFRI